MGMGKVEWKDTRFVMRLQMECITIYNYPGVAIVFTSQLQQSWLELRSQSVTHNTR